MLKIKRMRIRANQWMYRIGSYFVLNSIPLLRKASGEGKKQITVPNDIQWERVTVDGVASEWLSPPNSLPETVLLYLHGGGGVTGLYNSHRWMVGHIALACGIRVLLPDYQLAPEHPFPAGLNDCVTVYHWLLSNSYAPGRIIVAGDSAGGLLTISTLLALRQVNQSLPCAAVCISPAIDPAFAGKSMRTNVWKDSLLSPQFARTMMRLYIGDHDLSDPIMAPLNADLEGLPQILIQVGGDEILLDDVVHFSNRAKAAGINVTLEIWPHMWHVWHTCVSVLPEAKDAIDHISTFIHNILVKLE